MLLCFYMRCLYSCQTFRKKKCWIFSSTIIGKYSHCSNISFDHYQLFSTQLLNLISYENTSLYISHNSSICNLVLRSGYGAEFWNPWNSLRYSELFQNNRKKQNQNFLYSHSNKHTFRDCVCVVWRLSFISGSGKFTSFASL